MRKYPYNFKSSFCCAMRFPSGNSEDMACTLDKSVPWYYLFSSTLDLYVFIITCWKWHFCMFCYLQRYVADIGKTWAVLIVCGGILPLFLSIIWLLMIRHFVSAMTWITVILFDALIVSVTMFFYAKGNKTFLICFLMSSCCK